MRRSIKKTTNKSKIENIIKINNSYIKNLLKKCNISTVTFRHLTNELDGYPLNTELKDKESLKTVYNCIKKEIEHIGKNVIIYQEEVKQTHGLDVVYMCIMNILKNSKITFIIKNHIYTQCWNILESIMNRRYIAQFFNNFKDNRKIDIIAIVNPSVYNKRIKKYGLENGHYPIGGEFKIFADIKQYINYFMLYKADNLTDAEISNLDFKNAETVEKLDINYYFSDIYKVHD